MLNLAKNSMYAGMDSLCYNTSPRNKRVRIYWFSYSQAVNKIYDEYFCKHWTSLEKWSVHYVSWVSQITFIWLKSVWLCSSHELLLLNNFIWIIFIIFCWSICYTAAKMVSWSSAESFIRLASHVDAKEAEWKAGSFLSFVMSEPDCVCPAGLWDKGQFYVLDSGFKYMPGLNLFLFQM